MNRLFTPGIECTDPDSLQFCLRISDTEYWYCQPNIYHKDLFTGADTPARHILDLTAIIEPPNTDMTTPTDMKSKKDLTMQIQRIRAVHNRHRLYGRA